MTSSAPVPASPTPGTGPVRVSIVIPVYRGERTLEGLVSEIAPMTRGSSTPSDLPFTVGEIVLVHDGAVDGSFRVMLDLAKRHPFVSPLWLSRNFGQHPATLAGMASTSGDWVVTMDEDGQHDPKDIGVLLDEAIASGASLVYGRPVNPPPHGWLRNLLSRTAKKLVSVLAGNDRVGMFQSFRLVDGDVARRLAAFCGQGVYIDLALGWVVERVATGPVTLREEGGRASGYNLVKLFSYFWRLVLTAGTRPLRLVAFIGAFSMLVAAGLTAKALYEKVILEIPVEGWTSLIIAVSFFSGVILFSLTMIAEYIGLTLNRAMGRPTYLVVSHPPRQPGKKSP